ncbi:TetR family transcriptional regulator [Microbacterium pseudoresistens]|uniref:AcrR family transcriptional regulator n=1 Tax=Microbacterium pseudoresistens TaxID=640634 RepID=A0A7Y9JPE5_9MICO|nr:TetR/AcrR family transcriptional regulator [Microbacterium pseudoresistens]NYD55523.1 AcrR family transcriptional regulator [Microbacterium pseudoresistens]
MSKAERTRARIRDAALASFVDRGYVDTTMRLIAAEAEVSVGNAYYYFPSKEHLVQELYIRVQHEHAALARPLLAAEKQLVDRLRVVFETGLRTVGPYRRVAPGFLGAMMPPDSPINPLSEASADARALTVALFREAVDGSEHRLPPSIAGILPDALFGVFLALLLRWTYDSGEGQRQTARLLDTGLRLFAVAQPFLRVPGIRGVATDLLTQIAEVRA